MILTVKDRNVPEHKRIHAIQASDVDGVQGRIRTSLVVRVDPAPGTEIMLCRVGVELIEAQQVLAFINRQVFQLDRCNNRASPPAHRAIATPWVNQTIRKPNREFDAAAMALP